jgi:hypothetical protein
MRKKLTIIILLCLTFIVQAQVTSYRTFSKSFAVNTVDTLYIYLPINATNATAAYDTIGTLLNFIPSDVLSTGYDCLAIKQTVGGAADSIKVRIVPIIKAGLVTGEATYFLGSAGTYNSEINSTYPILLEFAGYFSQPAGYAIIFTQGDYTGGTRRYSFEFRTNSIRKQ